MSRPLYALLLALLAPAGWAGPPAGAAGRRLAAAGLPYAGPGHQRRGHRHWTVDDRTARIAMSVVSNGLLIEADIRDTDLRAPHTARDAALHEGDAFEIFLQCATGGTFYLELQVAPNGAFMDNLMLDRYWGRSGTADMPEWDIKGYELTVQPRGTINQPGDVDEGYSLRLLLPPSALKGNPHWPTAGQTWRGNFLVVDHGGTSAVPRVWTWSPSLRAGGFPHDQDRFGWIHTPVPAAPGD